MTTFLLNFAKNTKTNNKYVFFMRITNLRTFFGLALLPLAMLSASCGGGGDDDKGGSEPIVTKQYLTLSEQSIKDNQEVDAATVKSLTLSYNKMVTLSSTAVVTVNGSNVEPAISSTNVTIPLALESGKSYTVNAAEGTFVGKLEPNTVSPAFSLTFTTKKVEDVDNSKITRTLSNPDATQQAKNVYEYLLSQYGQKTVSASMANVNWNFAEAELVNKATGKYPAMATMDYIHLFTLTSHNPFPGWKVAYDDVTEAEKWWNNNGLIAASWHWTMPNTAGGEMEQKYTCTPGDGSQKNGNWTTTCKPSNIMKNGTWEKTIADEDLEIMASLLKKLQDKGIPVIFRPLHEASGNTYGQYAGGGAWFWWGIEGAEVYKQLWIYLYDYFHNAGVNNLIWVWTSQNNGDTDWYPGDAYVDIIGQDIYNKSAADNANDFTKLQTTYPNKMVTLSEFGGVGKISDQWSKGARWSYFMPWYKYDATTLDNHDHADTAWWTDAMNNANVITRDQMPSLK